jgi:hypothetical protein
MGQNCHVSNLSPQPISPLDGRYRATVAPLADYFSEAALNKVRIQIEVEWLIWLVEKDLLGAGKSISEAEKLSLRSQEGTLPKWVKTADAYVLWAINGINESTVCTSRRIIKHPANAGLYVQSTVYNTLAKLRESGLVTEQWIESLKVYVVTRQGQCALEAMENDYADNHLRRSARSLRIDS